MAVQFKEPGTVLFAPSGKVAMDPACCCEEPGPTPCDNCTEGTTLASMLVTIAGVVNRNCAGTECADAWNRQHTLTQDPLNPCLLSEYFNFDCGGGTAPEFLVAGVMMDVGLLIYTGSTEGHAGAGFSHPCETPADCLVDTLGDAALYVNDNFYCDFAAATCHVDAVS